MFALPLPLLTFAFAALACVLVWRIELGNRAARLWFTAVFALICISTFLIGMRFGYGVETLLLPQRLIPLFIGPTIYLGFLCMTMAQSRHSKHVATHLGVATIAALLPQAFPALRGVYDLIIAASYLFYAAALFLLWRKGPDVLTRASMSMAEALRAWMLAAAGMLTIMLVFDALIAVQFAIGKTDTALELITIGSTVSMLSLAVAIFYFSKSTPRAKPMPAATPTDTPNASSQALKLEATARALLIEQNLYLDTELTLERLAKRLHEPARAVSEAINQTQAMNVSQYVNGFRLDHAAKLLRDTNLSATKIMEQSGFLSRSNFYREFERVYGMSPVTYRKENT